MPRISRTILLTAAAASLATLLTSNSWAVATVCTTVGVGTPVLRLAIASNFYGPAQTMAQNYIDASGGRVNAVLVCQNSTGHLSQEITSGVELPPQMLPDPGFPRYDFFLAANYDAPHGLEPSTGTTSFLYARGIPVLYSDTDLNPAVRSAGDLITGLGAATHATISNTSLAQYTINPHALSVGVANPTAAPYGLAAKNITTAMGYAWAGNTPPTPPILPSLFANIDVTYQGVGTTVNGTFVGSAFVSKGQICPSIAKPVQYVEFTGFLLDQYALQLNASTAAAAFNTYFQQRLGTDWDNFLYQNCYGGIQKLSPVPVGPYTVPAAASLLLLLGMAYQIWGRRAHAPQDA